MAVVVYRCQLPEFVDLVDDFICNQCGFGEYLGTLYNPVADSRDFIHAGNDSAFSGGECLYQTLKCFCVGGECTVFFYLYASGGLVAQMTIDADTVAVALCDNRLILHVDELVLQGGASGIYN